MNKRLFVSTLLIAGAMMLSSCGTNNNMKKIYEPTTSVSDKNNSYDPATLSDYSSFVCSSFKPVLINTDSKSDNPVYSPLSVYMAFSMVAESAAGDTREAFLDVLGADDIEDLRKTNAEIFKDLAFFDKENGDLTLANSLWFNSESAHPFNDSAIKTLSEKYNAASFYLQCSSDPDAGKKIGNWISEKTNKMLNPEIQTNSEDVLRIVNAVHFKEMWSEQFEKSNNKTAPFTNFKNEQSDCTYLTGSFETGAAKCKGYTLCELDMANGFKMTFALPDENSSLQELMENEEKMNSILNGTDEFKTYNVNIELPKFKIKSSFDLLQAASEMGVPVKGDYSSLFKDEGPEGIGEIVHEAMLNVDENGCEAAAYTEILLTDGISIADETESLDFILNRPFFFNLTDENGTSVICGAVNDPNAE